MVDLAYAGRVLVWHICGGLCLSMSAMGEHSSPPYYESTKDGPSQIITEVSCTDETGKISFLYFIPRLLTGLSPMIGSLRCTCSNKVETAGCLCTGVPVMHRVTVRTIMRRALRAITERGYSHVQFHAKFLEGPPCFVHNLSILLKDVTQKDGICTARIN